MQTSCSDCLEGECAIVSQSTPTSGTASWRILYPVSQLCAFCQNLPRSGADHLKSLMSSCGPISERRAFLSLQFSAEAGCVLCQLVWRKVMNRLHPIDQETFNVDLLLVEVAVSSDNELCVHIFEGLEEYRRVFFAKLYRTEKNHLPWRNECRQVKSLAKGSLVEELRSMVEKEILPWLHSCNAQHAGHENCSRMVTGDIIPKRLIQVSKLQDDVVKLVETTTAASLSNEQYLILSYCWGQENSKAKTTARNLKHRLHGFFTETLPQTIQDAIALTKLMGFEFLWVDAICIIQSSEGDVGDFEDEALKMGDYYANAACCISASLASDSSQGLFQERVNAKFSISQVVLEYLGASNTQALPKIFEIPQEDASDLEKAISESPLMKRGWCMQELLLSRRIIHWTVQGLFRECQTSLFLEGDLRPWEGFHRGYFAKEYPRRILDLHHPESLTSQNWYKILQSFSRRHLTFLQDRRFAVQGIAALFMQNIKGEYTHGIFRSFLVQGLAWEADDHCYPPEHQHELESAELHFPTWSWASSGGIHMVTLSTECPTIQENVQLQIAKQGTIGGPPDVEARQIDESRLFIKAPLITVKLFLGTTSCTASISHKRVDKTISCLASYKLDLNRSVELFRSPDTIESLRSEDIYPNRTFKIPSLEFCHEVIVQWMPLGTVEPSGTHFGLILEELSTGGRATFFRYGCMTLHGSPNGSMSTCIRDSYNTLTDIVLV